MKEYTILLDNELSQIYETIAELSNKSTETIISDTLCKVVDLISTKITPPQ